MGPDRTRRRALMAVHATVVAGMVLAAALPGTALEHDVEVKITDLADITPLLIDPSGIAYVRDQNALIVVDSEIDEEPSLFAGVNLITLPFPFTSATGGLAPGGSKRAINEPTGLAYDPVGRRLLVTNDATDEVVFAGAGPDGRFGTHDDPISIPDYSGLAIFDLEDVAFDAGSEALYLLDGGTARVFRITPGADGVHGGSAPNGDDEVSVIELAHLGILDATGLEFVESSGSLLVTDARADAIFEISGSGTLVRSIDLKWLKVRGTALTPSDVTIAPASDGSGFQSLYVVDRGNDNGDPTDEIPPPRDGRLIELRVDFGGGRFTDDDDSVFQQDIEWIAEAGITLGCNPPANDRFCPDEPVTRGQMAAFLVRALGYSQTGPNLFVDDDDSVFEADIQKLAMAGVTRGCNPPANDRFCPDEPVTRGQMAAFLVRALGYSQTGPDLFVDDDDSVFEADIQKLAMAGVTLGCNPPANDRFCPDAPITRGQMAAFLRRALG